MFDQSEADALNDKIRAWDKDNKQELVNEMNQLNIKHYPYSRSPQPLQQALKSRVVEKGGLVNKISYKMPRSAVFVHKGVSKSHPKSNPRQAKEWFNPIVNKNTDKLAEIVAEGCSTLVVNSLKIK